MQKVLDRNSNKAPKKRRRITLARVIKTILITLAFVLMIGIIFIMVFPNSPINVFGVRVFLVSNTRSMEPDLSHNDLIVIRNSSFDELEVGDIVTFRTEVIISGQLQEIYVTHQIIDKLVSEETGEVKFRTSGTNPYIRPDVRLMSANGYGNTNEFVGVLSFHSGFLGQVFAYLRSPFGITMIVANAILIALMIYILLPEKDKKEKQVQFAEAELKNQKDLVKVAIENAGADLSNTDNLSHGMRNLKG